MKRREGSRVKEFLKRFAVVEVGVLGFLSSAKALLPAIEWEIWILTFSLVTLTSAVWIWRSTRPFHISEEVVSDSDAPDGEVSVEIPTPYHMLVAANKHARALYGRDALTLAEVESWWRRNPFVEAVIRSGCGDYLGYFDVLPLTEKGVELLESGRIREREIPAECILPHDEMKDAKALYLAGVAVKDAGSDAGKIRAAKLFLGLVSYVEHYYGKSPRRVLALAATSDGERLLKVIGATIVCAAIARKDKHDLYEVAVKPSLLLQVKTRAIRRGKPPKLIFRSTTSE